MILTSASYKIGLVRLDILSACDKVINNKSDRRNFMRIELEGSLIRMSPENDRERDELNQLWTIIIGCIDEGKKLVPVGEYLPGIKEVATFHIE